MKKSQDQEIVFEQVPTGNIKNSNLETSAVMPIPLFQLNQDMDVKNRIIYLVADVDLYTPTFIQQRANAIYEITGDNTSPITLSISCNGGDVYGMFGAIDIINQLPTKVNTLGIGTVQSAATTILAAGTGSRKLTKNTIVMIHQISTWFGGQTEDIDVEVKHTKALQMMLYSALGEKSSKPAEFWKKQSKNNLYLPADKCLEYGLIDEIV